MINFWLFLFKIKIKLYMKEDEWRSMCYAMFSNYLSNLPFSFS